MLEHVPAWLGNLLTNVRAGHEKLSIGQPGIAGAAIALELSSPAFAAGGRLPERFTADGPGVSPPLRWGEVPAATTALALIVEDPDAPARQPLVHAIAWNIATTSTGLAEGAISAGGEHSGAQIGRNSFLSQGWLPPDPPTGHGTHDYVFQLFALRDAVALGDTPGRAAFIEAITGQVLGAGLLIGTYSRDERLAEAVGVAVPA